MEEPAVLVGLTPTKDGGATPHFESTCARKVAFKTKRAGWFALRGMNRDGKNCLGAVVYQCAICNEFHIGRPK